MSANSHPPAKGCDDLLVDILLAAYNGSKYLDQQLLSLSNQTYGKINLIVRDDASIDSTKDILERFRRNSKYPIEIRYNSRNLGVVPTINLLLQESSARYVMLCDQDDIWLPGKVEKTLRAMRQAEMGATPAQPMLAFTDLSIVDDSLTIQSPSLWKRAGVKPAGAKFRNVLCQNLATGCASMANRALLDFASPIPEDAAMHDYWLTLTAVAFGKLVPVDEATILYRQHGANVVGVGQRRSFRSILSRLRRDPKLQRELAASSLQITAFLTRFGARLSAKDRIAAEEFIRMVGHGSWVRRYSALRYGLYRTGLRNNIGYLLRL